MIFTDERIAVSVSPDTLNLPPGGRAAVTLDVTNLGSVVEEFDLTTEGIDPAWIKLRTPSVRLVPQARGLLEFDVEIPATPEVIGAQYSLRLRVASSGNSGNATLMDLPLEVATVGQLEMKLLPDEARTRGTAHLRVQLWNGSNVARTVHMAIVDPEEKLDAQFANDSVELAAQREIEIGLKLRPRRRRLIASPSTYPFTIQANADGDKFQAPQLGATGTLVYEAPLAILATLPVLASRLLFGVALLMVLLAFAVWRLGAPGLQTVFEPPARPTVQPTAVTAQSVERPAESAGEPGVAVPAAPDAAAPPGPALPIITQYELSVSPDAGPGEFELRWQVDGADSVSVGGVPMPSAGTARLNQPDGGQFELVATNQTGLARKSIGVVMLRPPEIQSFESDLTQVEAGDSVTLSWRLKRANRAAVNGETVAADHGTVEVQPTTDSTYTLVAENELGRVQQAVTVNVSAPSPQAD